MIQELVKEIDSLYESIKQPLDRTPEGLLAELDFRCQWLARSAEIEAESQEYLDKKRGEEAEKANERGFNATTARDIINAQCSLEKRLYTLAERLNSTLVHQIDSIRSILSYEKEGIKNTGHRHQQ